MAFSHLGRALDIEWFLRTDEMRPAADLEREDRTFVADASSPKSAFALWLERRRASLQHRTLGLRTSELLTVTHTLLVVLSLASGSATAEALLLSSAHNSPTNVLTFLFATLVWPFAFLLVTLTLLGIRQRVGASILLSEAYAGLVSLVDRIGRHATDAEWSVAKDWRAIRRQQQRYRDIELLSFGAATQWYALAFHLGAALSLLRAALLSDLTFAWSTTNSALEWDTLATFFSVLTAPWCATTGWACVSPDLVQATEFVRFNGEYAAANGATVSGAWWAPLFLSLLVYGVLPRLGVSLVLQHLLRRRAAQLPQRVVELRRLLHRGISVSKHASSDTPDGAQPGKPGSAPSAQPTSTPGDEPAWLITWRGAVLPADHGVSFASELGLTPTERAAAGGADFGADEALTTQLSASPATPVIVVVDGWEAPDKATRRFLQAVRNSGQTQRQIFVAVLSSPLGSAAELRVWRDRLGLLEDPFLSVERLSVIAQAASSETHEARA